MATQAQSVRMTPCLPWTSSLNSCARPISGHPRSRSIPVSTGLTQSHPGTLNPTAETAGGNRGTPGPGQIQVVPVTHRYTRPRPYPSPPTPTSFARPPVKGFGRSPASPWSRGPLRPPTVCFVDGQSDTLKNVVKWGANEGGWQGRRGWSRGGERTGKKREELRERGGGVGRDVESRREGEKEGRVGARPPRPCRRHPSWSRRRYRTCRCGYSDSLWPAAETWRKLSQPARCDRALTRAATGPAMRLWRIRSLSLPRVEF